MICVMLILFNGIHNYGTSDDFKIFLKCINLQYLNINKRILKIYVQL